jgi:alkylation response protein AidB-like acyl-CoA dehydrogenase
VGLRIASRVDAGKIVRTARRIADDALFPSAMAADRADAVPRENLDVLADAGLYGLSGPTWAGGLDADFATICAVTEILASGCLTTGFVWTQHHGAVRAAAASETPEMKRWVGPLCEGQVRAGLALGGVLPGPPILTATRVDGGWKLDGRSPWVSGWGRVDVIHAAARLENDDAMWFLVDARESETLRVHRLELMALNATATVTAEFRGHLVAEDRVTSTASRDEWSFTEPATLRIHAAFALGVAARCCALLGPSPLDDQLIAVRAALDAAMADPDPGAMPRARAVSSELALRASAALMSSVGSRSLLVEEHAQRLAREAMFVAVYAGRPPVRAALLESLLRRR